MKLSITFIFLVSLVADANASCHGDCKIQCNPYNTPYCNSECVGRCMAARCPEYVNYTNYNISLNRVLIFRVWVFSQPSQSYC